jgi:hypothetical protein
MNLDLFLDYLGLLLARLVSVMLAPEHGRLPHGMGFLQLQTPDILLAFTTVRFHNTASRSAFSFQR